MDEVSIIIVPTDIYTVWILNTLCLDSENDKLITIEERRELVRAECFENYPDEPIEDDEDLDEYMYDNLENYPLLYSEFNDLYQGISTDYVSKSGDKITVVAFTDSY